MIVQLNSDLAINTDYVLLIQRGNETGETFIILGDGKWNKEITLQVPLDEVLNKIWKV
jgi:hypothetical protein